MKKYTDLKLAYPVIEAGVDADIMGMKALRGYDEVFAELHRMGYQAVELQVRNPENVDVATLETALTRYQLSLAAIGTSPMQKLDHLFLLGRDRDRCDECFRRAEKLVTLCAHFDAVMLVGKMRGTVEDEEGCRLTDLGRIIEKLATRASDEGVRIAIEPQNPTNINNLHTLSETMTFLEALAVQPGIVGIHADLYHMEISETDMLESLKKYAAAIRFIHIADTERKVPGDGRMDYAQILATLSASGYKGFLSPEIRQLPDSRTAAERTIAFFNEEQGA